ncbi:MAG: prolipoprotein diacylglyceryl transferase, partial [Nocardioides sp.]
MIPQEIPYPGIDPVFHLGPLPVHWYGVSYVVGFAIAWWLGRRRAAKPGSGWSPTDVDDVIFYSAVGVILGGRIGYVLFYGFDRLLADPLYLVKITQGGMSFHGGLLGVLVAMAVFARRQGRSFWAVTDFLAPLVPLGLFSGRIGNFINGELWGKVTDVPWAMVFPSGGDQPRHPSMLYEAILEGLVLFAVLWSYTARRRPVGAASGVFLVGYAVCRFSIEFVRVPDSQLGYLAFGWVTMGQLLTLPMLLLGGWLLWRARHAEEAAEPASDEAASDEPSSDESAPDEP